MSDIDLESKFPDMRPVRSAPSLFTALGFGLGVYGARDFDEETGTYVKTHCLCLLFIPVLALGAYRVAKASAGWYFLGRVPLSALAKAWNCLLVLALLGAAGFSLWHKHTRSPEYVAAHQIAEADALAAEGRVVPAAQLYRQVALGKTDQATAAANQLMALVEGPVTRSSADEAAAVLEVAVAVNERHPLANLFEHGRDLAVKHADADPRGALAILDAIGSLPAARNAKDWLATRQRLLERLLQAEPDNLRYASELAVVHEARGDLARCEAVLAPLRQRLGTSEGARILGQVYARQGKAEEAYALLQPYVNDRLGKLHAAEQALKAAHQHILDDLNTWQAPDFDYERYQRSTKAEQLAQLQECVAARFQADPALRAVAEAAERETAVVPVALDLGIARLHRAQALADPKARRAELEKAEQTFLAVRDQAGGSEDYRLSLGQVYYWLGKPAEGRRLFDEQLKAGREFRTLLRVSRLLRELGAVSEARPLAEEAYHSNASPTDRYNAAEFRAYIYVDSDDRITWLRRADPAEPQVQAELSSALGHKAMQEGKDQEAVAQFRRAIELYSQLPPQAATLNNSAGNYSLLYYLTGERGAQDRVAELYEKALALQPRSSILLRNTARTALEVGLRDVIGPAIDLGLLRTDGDLHLLSYLYQDQAGRERYAQKVRRSARVARALSYLDRLQVLAPKNDFGYATLASVHNYTRSAGALRGLAQRLEGADLDLTDSVREQLEHYAGKDDAKRRDEYRALSRRLEKVLNEARKAGRGVTLAVAATNLASHQLHLAQLGLEADADQTVALAEEALAAAPSQGTRWMRIYALLDRASRSLARQEPAYAALASRSLRSLGSAYLIAVALSRDGKPREAARKNPDVQKALALVADSCAKDPDESSELSWALLHGTHRDVAAEVGKTILADEVRRLERAIDLRLSPVDVRTALNAYWAAQIAGKEAEGVAVLKGCAARGAPLPFEAK